ncbi:FixH family protein [Oceanobacillus damuensis]|uniref:FixH family protein n=1 Tax=Oceanobacillus damuensis TaxID=937928 RepID=UPI00082D3606|nr:FixH family protein [Oceanobacillus damuensis]
MLRKQWLLLLVIVTLAACNGNEESADEKESEELPILEVDFEVPVTAEVNESIDLTAIVTYDNEPVTDADEVVFEVWEKGQRDDNIMIESDNNKDGSYTAEATFEKDGIYEIHAHTTARDLHTMPLKEVIVGNASPDDYEEAADEEEEEEESHQH